MGICRRSASSPSSSTSSASSFALLLLALGLAGTAGASVKYVNRRTLSGEVRGEVKRPDGAAVDVEHFLGVPFARPPVGRLRFKKPQPVDAWSGVKDTLLLPATCWQYLPVKSDQANPMANMWLNNTAMSEDCLYLNVWVPRGGRARKAMVVWIFGGGFISGSSTIEVYNGALMAAKGDVVVASMQYRVGAFGFLHLQPATASGASPTSANAGLWDQNMAMAWLHRNAAKFGADPAQITLMGESAGAASVSMHLLSPHSERLFARAILHSASFLAPWSIVAPQLAHQRAVNLAWAVGCLSSARHKAALTSGRYSAAMAECLRGVPAIRVVNNLAESVKGEAERRQRVLGAGGFPSRRRVSGLPNYLLSALSMVPVQEPDFFPLTPFEAHKRAQLKRAPLLVGTNQDEGGYFLLYYLPPLSALLSKAAHYRNVTEAALTREPAAYIADYLLPDNYLFPEVLDQVLLTYRVPSLRLSPIQLAAGNKRHWIDLLDDVAGDLYFKCCSLALAEWYAATPLNQSVYVYNFEHRTTNNSFPAWTGTMHGYELEYLFGMPYNRVFQSQFYSFNAAERSLSDYMIRMWTNFIKSGNPNIGYNPSVTPSSPVWPLYKLGSEQVMRLQTASNRVKAFLGTNSRRQQCQLWMKVIPKLAARLTNTTCTSAAVSKGTGLQIHPVLLSSAMLLTAATLHHRWLTVTRLPTALGLFRPELAGAIY